MKLRERIANWIVGKDSAIVDNATLREWRNVVATAYHAGPAVVSPEHLVENLMQMTGNSEFVFNLLEQLRGLVSTDNGSRLRAVNRSRYMYWYDVQIHHAVNVWTDWGMGQYVMISSEDKQADEVLQEFWTARRNSPIISQTEIAEQSNNLQVDGEFFYIYYTSKQSGKTTIRRIPTEEITEIIFDDGDNCVPVYYVRTITNPNIQLQIGNKSQIYYPDWQASARQLDKVTIPPQAIRADEVNGDELFGTAVVAQMVAINKAGPERRGWPNFMRAWAWSKAYWELLQDWATVAKQNAMFAREVTAKGSSRAVDSIISRFASNLSSTDYTDSNPPAIAGSTLVHNDAVTTKEVPLNRGAGDAQTTGYALAGQISAETGLPLHIMGLPGAMQNRATARETERPFLEQMERYQLFWSSVIRDMCEIVLRQYEKTMDVQFTDYDVSVSMQTPLMTEIQDVNSTIKTLQDAAVSGVLDAGVAMGAVKALAEIDLNILGIDDTEEILEPPTVAEAFHESHVAETINHTCPLCGFNVAERYEGHGSLVVCANCHKTYDTAVE